MEPNLNPNPNPNLSYLINSGIFYTDSEEMKKALSVGENIECDGREIFSLVTGDVPVITMGSMVRGLYLATYGFDNLYATFDTVNTSSNPTISTIFSKSYARYLYVWVTENLCPPDISSSDLRLAIYEKVRSFSEFNEYHPEDRLTIFNPNLKFGEQVLSALMLNTGFAARKIYRR